MVSPDTSPREVTEKKIADEIISVKLSNKRLQKQDYERLILFDAEFKAIGLDKPARAIKGVLCFNDLFGETKLRISWTLNDPIAPGGKITQKGYGFEYNQFQDSHKWVLGTDLKDMTTNFTVNSIIYQDGDRRDLM